MCQLLGMNCNTPTDIGFSFAGFRQRGGNTDHHDDGFGIAFFERATQYNNMCKQAVGLRVFHDDKPCYNSPIADLINQHTIKAINVIAHIRKATQGDNCLANTHPFVREVWGEQWVFAHNGQMNKEFIVHAKQQPNKQCNPVGTTDSEMAFCYLLNNLKKRFSTKPTDAVLFEFLTEQCDLLASYGLYNCLLSNGDWQLAYAGSLLFYLTRKAPFGKAVLFDEEISINFQDVTTEKDRVTIITTIPLTSNESWQQLAVNECVIFKDGYVVYQHAPKDKKHLSIEEGIAIARLVGASV